ncbi:MAG: YigZ family protein [Candidatus Cloacimonas sp.]|jgi:uncharacterized YigZ family protein|nr:YigZ family protein [Candidatus Cloacimonas sp.]
MMRYTITNITSYEIKILRSRFIAFLYPIENAEDVKNMLTEHGKLYSDATHNCYAYILGLNQETTYYSDAGEPGGTAGKPILNAMLRAEMCNCLAVVTRYYGGIKLGVKGLIESYGSVVSACIAETNLIEAKELVSYAVTCAYPLFETLKHQLTELEAEFCDIAYGQEVSFTLHIPVAHQKELNEILAGYASQNRLNYQVE